MWKGTSMNLNNLLRLLLRRGSIGHSSPECNIYRQIHTQRSQEMTSPMPDIIQPKLPLHQYIWENSESWHHHTAVVCGVSGKRYTYGKLLKNSQKVGKSLVNLGLKAGDCVTLCLPNSPDFPLTYLAAMEAGLIVHALHSQTSLEEMRQRLETSKSKCVICHPSNIDLVKQAVESRNIIIICTDGIGNSRPSLPHQIVLLDELQTSSFPQPSENLIDDDLSKTNLIVYSSGTAGRTKGICLTHKSLTANVEQMLQFSNITQTHGDHQDVIPAIIPFCHAYGHAILMMGLRMGAKIVCLPKFEPSLFSKTIVDYENLLLFLDRQTIEFLEITTLTHKYFERTKEIVVTKGLDNYNKLKKIQEKTNASISQVYGMSEMSPIVSWTPREDWASDRYRSNGILVGSTKCKVISPETNNILPAYVIGELYLKGPQMMKGYLAKADCQGEGTDTEGWLHTGDTGYYDDLGHLYIIGRQEELVGVSGFQVSVSELEDIIKKLPGVSEAAVTVVPRKTSGETLVAFVQLERESRESEKSIMKYINSRVFKYKHLSLVKIVREIPKTIYGKIIRSQLKNMI